MNDQAAPPAKAPSMGPTVHTHHGLPTPGNAAAPGMYGTDRFTAVINPPEAAILAAGAALAEPVATQDGTLEVHRRMRLTLSIDHRALDGAAGARFLQQLETVLEHPLQIVA